MKTVLVTGGAGFLGSHLVDRLLAMGIRVRVLDNLFRGSAANLSKHRESPDFTFIQGDILDFPALLKAASGVDTVFHMAAINGTRYFYEQPQEVLKVNSLGTMNVFQAADELDVNKVVFASSSEVYGTPGHFPTSEAEPINLDPPKETRWCYAVSKLLGEHLSYAANKRGIDTIVLRYFNAYGPRLLGTPYGQVVSIFIRDVLKGTPPTINGHGRQTRSFTYVTDTIEATIAAAETERAVGEVLNIGSQDEVTILELATKIIDLCGQSGTLRPVHVEPLPADSRRRVPDTTKTERVLGFRPKVSLTDGLKKTIHWFRESETC